MVVYNASADPSVSFIHFDSLTLSGAQGVIFYSHASINNLTWSYTSGGSEKEVVLVSYMFRTKTS